MRLLCTQTINSYYSGKFKPKWCMKFVDDKQIN